MRIFRVKKVTLGKGKIETHRDYLGINKFILHAPELIDRYNGKLIKEVFNVLPRTKAEVYELVDNNWIKLEKDTVYNILNNYGKF